MKPIYLLLITLLLASGCSGNIIKPDIEIHSETPEEVKAWAEKNKNDHNARIYTIHSDNMKNVMKWFVRMGFKTKFIK